MVTPPGLEPGFPPWKGGVLDRLDDGAMLRGFSPRRWTRPMRRDLIVNLLFIVAEPAHFFDNSFFFYGSLLEPLHSFIAEIPVHPQVLVYLFRPGASGKERNSELTNITESIILSACAYTGWSYIGQIRLERHRHKVSCYWSPHGGSNSDFSLERATS